MQKHMFFLCYDAESTVIANEIAWGYGLNQLYVRLRLFWELF